MLSFCGQLGSCWELKGSSSSDLKAGWASCGCMSAWASDIPKPEKPSCQSEVGRARQDQALACLTLANVVHVNVFSMAGMFHHLTFAWKWPGDTLARSFLGFPTLHLKIQEAQRNMHAATLALRSSNMEGSQEVLLFRARFKAHGCNHLCLSEKSHRSLC